MQLFVSQGPSARLSRRSRVAPAPYLDDELECRWWRRDGKALAGRVRRCCREAAAPPGTPFLGNDPGGAWRLPLNPRSDDSSRLVEEGGAPVRSRCHRSARALRSEEHTSELQSRFD